MKCKFEWKMLNYKYAFPYNLLLPVCVYVWDEILGHQFNKRFKSSIHSPFYWRISKKTILAQRWNSWTSVNKRLESFALWFSQSLLLADFIENHSVLFSETEFLDIILTKDSSHLLHAIDRSLQTVLFSGLKFFNKEICETRELHFVERKNEG